MKLDGKFDDINSNPNLENFKLINRMQYIMSYGEYTICYDFFLN